MLCYAWLFVTLWTIAHQAPLSMRFPRQEYWSGLPCPPPGIFLTQGLNPSLLQQLLHCRQILHRWATGEAEISYASIEKEKRIKMTSHFRPSVVAFCETFSVGKHQHMVVKRCPSIRATVLVLSIKSGLSFLIFKTGIMGTSLLVQ